MIAPDESHKVTPELVMDVVSDHFNVSVSELKGSRRNAERPEPRQIVMYLCRQMTIHLFKVSVIYSEGVTIPL